MPLQDASPERRNLMATSLGFIAYYLGGGSLIDNQLRIQMVNITFENPAVLAAMAWLALLWFLLRYWQTHRETYHKELLKELSAYGENKTLIKYMERRLNVNSKADGGFVAKSPWRYDNRHGVTYTTIKSPSFDAQGRLGSYSPGESGVIYFDGVQGKLALTHILILCTIQKRSFSEYVIPYFLFISALASAIISTYSNNWYMDSPHKQ